MTRRLALSLITLVTLVFISGAGASSTELIEIDGTKDSLKPYTGHGKWVVAMIWAHDCHVCNEDAPKYVKFHQKHKDKDAVVLGISLDGHEHLKEAQQYIKRHKIPYTNLIGEPLEVTGLYEQLTGRSWIGTPTFMIFHPSGKLVAEQAGNAPPELVEEFIANYKK